MLEYKCKWPGRTLVKVARFFPSSKLCCICHQKKVDLKLQDRWTCSSCNTEHQRDENAVVNIFVQGLRILAEGRSVLACGGTAGPKREFRRGSRQQTQGNSNFNRKCERRAVLGGRAHPYAASRRLRNHSHLIFGLLWGEKKAFGLFDHHRRTWLLSRLRRVPVVLGSGIVDRFAFGRRLGYPPMKLIDVFQLDLHEQFQVFGSADFLVIRVQEKLQVVTG
ncbi:MAG: hypothetical protein DMG38_01070 [Acidobacteria bacterium]|nr:MAG: hypothetical protein DMG38_01070 [Acidobacteriota bacterium]